MKEIDFLPDWYKQGRTQQKKHREFYFAMGLIVAVMAIWSVFANGRIALIMARTVSLGNARLLQSRSEAEYSVAENKYEQLKAESETLKMVEPRIVVSNVIAELTHLLDGRIVLKKIEIKTEPLEFLNKQTSVRTVSAAGAEQASPFEEDTKFKIIITGLAADATEVAGIINRLEKSGYFFQVVPDYSRNVTTGEYQASEFEISCYLANFKQS